jgi:glycosyltransferase involved in cell wall biosynthesis
MKISGLLPVHNGEKFIDTCLPLILRNLYPDDELIVIDNGSTDGSNIKLKRWSGVDSRIRLIATKKPGLVEALNLGVEESNNKWIARFDVDDIYEPDRLKNQRVAINEKTVLIFTDYDFFSNSHNYLGTIPSAIESNAVSVSLISSQRTAHPSALFSKEAVVDAGCYKEIDFPAEDLSLWLRMSRLGKIVSIPETLLHYRLSPGSTSGTRRTEAKDATKKLLIDIGINQKNIQDLVNTYDSVVDLYKKHSFSREREILLLRDLYHVSKNYKIDDKTKKKIKQILIRHIPKLALNIPTLQAINLLYKQKVLRNQVRENLS